MKTIDHKTLVYLLLSKNINENLNLFEKAFVFGCIEPDINILTYMKGSIKFKKLFCGHTRKHSLDYILKNLEYLNKQEKLNIFDFYKLGKIMHYIADSFTYPHTENFKGNIIEHTNYENKLHLFLEENKLKFKVNKNNDFQDLKKYLLDNQEKYNNQNMSIENDLKFIVNICSGITNAIIKHEYDCLTISFIPKIILNESYIG
ncbi:MAG: zinc dependent phospholipase C family protein [Clostridium sp.]